jgi:xanthine dehydrogenase accessory factor
MKDVLATLQGWVAQGDRVAIAVLVERRGSAPRDPGAVLALSSRGAIAGSVTGGCVEPALLREAEDVLVGGAPRVVTYGIADEAAFDVGLACGGTVALVVAELDGTLLEPLARALAADRPVAFAVHVAGNELGRQVLLQPEDEPVGLAGAAAPLLAAGESALVEHEGALVFVDAFAPRPSLYVLGAIDHAAALTRVGQLLGYTVTVCDARAAFVTPERFPHADELVVDWPDRFLRRAEVDERSAVCVLTHDIKFDVPALLAALETPARYIGAMGSLTTTAEREERLRAEGVGDADLARIHAPIGLPIGARSPEEVAVAIGAQIVEASAAARRRLVGRSAASVIV